MLLTWLEIGNMARICHAYPCRVLSFGGCRVRITSQVLKASGTHVFRKCLHAVYTEGLSGYDLSDKILNFFRVIAYMEHMLDAGYATLEGLNKQAFLTELV